MWYISSIFIVTNFSDCQPRRANIGIKVVGKFEPYEACILGKAKHQKINKIPVEFSNIQGECLYLDTSSLIGKKYWLLMVDNATGYLCSYFLKYKRDLTENLLGSIKGYSHPMWQFKWWSINVGTNLESFCSRDGIQTGRDGNQVWIQCPKYAAAQLSSRTIICTHVWKVWAMPNYAKLTASPCKKL